ncbi:helix-turn-helix domain-containing protein [Paenibacillus melissococcoides]|uniref:Helix-turn-helix domain-containing protein n=1 Tax=Paenibacillus melissococcoides TaxID=2912268 RepID=A0ABM9FWP8_9BACL|nr:MULTISPECIES: helix-turn-helix transcriptional regulator [Paenibacillus]MEB9897610.1 helix-turn-helix transcriptional regulator [Bacillus cereus]CAH8243598.1 helix-turn-helix domain-containing protein [Paenibacillus melissococcoides]CAH8704980.1 helix-turn-helix domain-containing protein [Paenibacillus melissococcoides]CAH8708207.1 helix-turn-helix domain-containing protein [Paenibacillus melissococcoides]GIO83023.1 hypothetical protein J6TS7_66330 [Paenibacillus dendritiformis]
MNDIPVQFKETLRSLRIKLGFNQKEAATMIGVTTKTLRSWEKDSQHLPYSAIKKIEKAYGVSQDYIFFGSEVAFSELFRKRLVS